MIPQLICAALLAVAVQSSEYDCNALGGSCLTRPSCPSTGPGGRAPTREGLCPYPEQDVTCCLSFPPTFNWRTTGSPPVVTSGPVIPSGKCGVSGGNFRIISGVVSNQGQWPWQVGMWLNDKHVCGGSLIDAETVVTAAHCAILSLNPRDWKILYGSTSRINHPGTVTTLRAIRMHERYNNDVTKGNDVAIMKLSRPVKFDQYTSTVCLPSGQYDNFPVGTKCFTSGWGTTGAHFNMARDLRHVDVQIIDSNRCAQGIKQIAGGMLSLNKESSVCTYGNDNVHSKSACKGDSGGPLVCQRNGRWFLQGITSWGDFPCGQPGKPAIFTRVPTFMDWIQRNRY